jgi:hypothetical protein
MGIVYGILLGGVIHEWRVQPVITGWFLSIQKTIRSRMYCLFAPSKEATEEKKSCADL